MDSLKKAAFYAKATAQTTVWAANAARRNIASKRNGVCLVCNNLQPYNHEETFGRTSTPWKDREWANRADLIQIPTLALENIPALDILNSRRTDPETGKLKNDCAYCRLLCDIFDSFFGFETDRWDHYALSGSPVLTVGLMIREGSPLVINCNQFEWDPTIHVSRVDLEVYVEDLALLQTPGMPMLGITGRRALDSSDDSCTAFAVDCMLECLETHPRCKTRANVFVPTRLLRLGKDNNRICLYETSITGSATRYAALSHCWGPDPKDDDPKDDDPKDDSPTRLRLTTENIAALRVSIAWNDLPATFQDGIRVCRNLGIGYLWIDSLCIIQDGDEGADWVREAAVMGKVYASALVVISGAASGKSGTPFIGPRKDSWGGWNPRRFELSLPSDIKVPIMARRRHLLAPPLEQGLHEPAFTNAWGYLRRPGPLAKRAWCFQESFLAVRVVEYAPGSLIFECKTHRRAEDQLPPYPQTFSDVLGKVDDGAKWRQLVKQYTSRELKYGNDKLPAIGGTAAAMPQSGRTPYLAGLWLESLLFDLMWHIEPDTSHQRLTFSKQKNSLPVTAPSWSWASLNRAVLWDPFRGFHPLAEVLEHRMMPKDDMHRFGQVLVGLIHVMGRLRSCKIYWKAPYHRAYFLRPDGTKTKEQHFLADGSLVAHKNPESTAAQELLDQGWKMATRAQPGDDGTEGELDAAVLVLGRTALGNYNHVGLVVAPSMRHVGAWERLGAIVNLSMEWWSSGEERAIMLS